MYKHTEKRFQYDINPQLKQLDRPSNKYNNNRNYPEYANSTNTPINKRSVANNSILEEKDRHNLSINQDTSYNTVYRNQQKFQRNRANSTSAIKKNNQRPPLYKSNKNTSFVQESQKQTKKIYFGGDESYDRDFDPTLEKHLKIAKKQYEESRYRGQQGRLRQSSDVYTLQQNVNYSNTRYDQSKQQKSKKQQSKNESQNRHNQINQKQIVDKINRINRLNEEINSRLQRMLNKMQS